MNFQNELTYLCALRGATTCENNSVESITSAVEELLVELVSRNNLIPDQIISVTFSVTSDLDACFPASVARKKIGWEKDEVDLYEINEAFAVVTMAGLTPSTAR